MTIHVLESRDDSVHCLQAEQKEEVFLDDICFMNTSKRNIERHDNFYYPVLKLDMKNEKIIQFNWFLFWKLYKNDELILEHKYKNIKILGTYKKGELQKTRKKCLEMQKIKKLN